MKMIKSYCKVLIEIIKRKVEVIRFLRNELPIPTVLERTKTVDVLGMADQEYIHIELNSNMQLIYIIEILPFSSIYSKQAQPENRGYSTYEVGISGGDD